MPWQFNHKKGQWVNEATGQVLAKAPTSGTGTAFDTDYKGMLNKVVQKQFPKWQGAPDDKVDDDVKKKQQGVECPGHKDAILVLKRDIKVWAGSATKTETYPDGALILDLANKYGNGLRGEGIELPQELMQKRIIFDWPDMSKPYLFKDEWGILTNWLKGLDAVREHGLYVACLEGHGRTGTALAILAHYFGEWNNDVDVVRQIRKKYCRRAVETVTQIEYFQQMTGRKTKCIGSNVGNFQSGTGTYKTNPCYKATVSTFNKCEHNCTGTTMGHKEHWCGRCKMDWYVTREGLWEKPGPGYKGDHIKPDNKDGWQLTPGQQVINVYDAQGNLKITETFEQDGYTINVVPKTTTDPKYVACWDTSDYALDQENGNCETSDDQHLCGGDKEHTDKHKCLLCGGWWTETADLIGEDIPTTEGCCMAVGGEMSDHQCLCTDPLGHESSSIFGRVHKCSTCDSFFEESEGND